ncbi:hypothetical protein F4775DRAFT_572805 [Biscogniauxia sp. FL1348]|nr:hypothetical protein F4775DRAFT_572805 [Biscogniauxia sp. FL1348]
MPALHTLLLNTLITRDNTTNPIAANATGRNPLQVVCAWPVSGQYGAGSRVLYYVLVTACVVARKTEWLRNPCLAAALLLPVIAALHGIVLAAVHVDGAVDMDIYGVFQLCAIGILAAPVTVRLSRTYFWDPGRNIIFLWTGVILAGLLSLVVEFYRSDTVPCVDVDGNHVLSNDFHNGDTFCRLQCSPTDGPFSPLRRDATNELFVIRAPSKLSFNAVTLLAAACCIPAILSLIFTWNKIVEINWKRRSSSEGENLNEPIEGTNGATIREMRSINNVIRMFLSTLEIPVFSAAVLAILIIGEQNFFSPQVSYQTEPIKSVGQWGPIIGTVLGALGSLYLLLAREQAEPEGSKHHCNCSQHHFPLSDIDGISTRSNNESLLHAQHEWPVVRHYSPSAAAGGLFITPSRNSQSPLDQNGHIHDDVGYRRKVARALTRLSNYLGNAGADRFDDSDFRRGRAVDFPEIPAERERNGRLFWIKKHYDPPRDANGNATPIIRARPSGPVSDAASEISVLAINDAFLSSSPQHAPHPQAQFPVPKKARANTLPSKRTPFESYDPALAPCLSLGGDPRRLRRDTLEVPLPVRNYHHHYPSRDNISTSSGPSSYARHDSQSSPEIVISTELDPPSPVHFPAPRLPNSP